MVKKVNFKLYQQLKVQLVMQNYIRLKIKSFFFIVIIYLLLQIIIYQFNIILYI